MLITTKDLEDYSGVSGDPLALEYVESACEVVENYLGYCPELSERSEDHDGTGADFIALKAGNIVEVTAVVVDGIEWSADGLYARGNFLYMKCGRFPCGRNNVHVEYKAGWDAESMPRVIRTTALQIAALRQIESGQNIGVNSKSFGDSGTRVFLSTRKYDDFLLNISRYKVI